jgi:diguanylate cyclase (GGDEF)-like protein/PAS domain S-box-containing protein
MFKSSISQLVAVCPDPIIGVDRTGVISLFNSASEMLLGYPQQDVLQRLHITRLYPSINEAREVMRLLQISHDKRLRGYETQLVSRSGRVIDIRLSAALLLEKGVEIGSVGYFHDLTEQKCLETRLKQLADTDELTGLYNRRHFQEVLKKEIDRAHRYHRPLSLLCADIDGFKQVNDCLGHLRGDEALRLAGKTILAVIRNTDIAFRYGGDEFMVLLPETSVDDTGIIAERMRDTFANDWADRAERHGRADSQVPLITMSLGLVELRPRLTMEQLVGCADASMYRAKRAGGNRIECG